MTHLTADELIDALEGGTDCEAHLAACEHCQRELAALASVLGEAKQASVPEPSPLFWQHFSERVRASIDDDAPEGAWPAWLRWRVLLPLGAVAMIILGLMISVPKQDSGVTEVAMEEAALVAEDGWTLVANLIGDLTVDTAAEAGVLVTPGLADQAALDLTADEQEELTRLLKAELARAKS